MEDLKELPRRKIFKALELYTFDSSIDYSLDAIIDKLVLLKEKYPPYTLKFTIDELDDDDDYYTTVNVSVGFEELESDTDYAVRVKAYKKQQEYNKKIQEQNEASQKDLDIKLLKGLLRKYKNQLPEYNI